MADGQWYLHLSAPEQPDLDFTNPEAVADLETTLRCWLGRGVDGLRIDVAHGMAKPQGLPDMVPMEDTGLLADHGRGDHRFDQDGVHAIHRRVRAVLDRYPGTMAVGEVWWPTTTGWPSTCAPMSCTWPSTSRRSPPTGTATTCGRRSSTRRPPWRPSPHRPAGCRPITTACGTSPATATASGAPAGPGRRRCCIWRCPGRRTSTTATSSADPTSTCPTRCCGTRSGSGPGTPSAAGTPAGCRCRPAGAR